MTFIVVSEGSARTGSNNGILQHITYGGNNDKKGAKEVSSEATSISVSLLNLNFIIPFRLLQRHFNCWFSYFDVDSRHIG